MKTIIIGATLLALSASSYASLYARDLDGNLGNGHEGVYDDVLDITWLADANLHATNNFGLDGNNGISGQLSWSIAELFIANMNADNGGAGYLGVNTWRQTTAGGCTTYNCGDAPVDTINELSYHFYQNFGATADNAMTSGSEVANLGLFSNIQDWIYWTGTEVDSTLVFVFTTTLGYQTMSSKTRGFHVWAVADGDVGAIPLPAAAYLFGSALAGLGLSRRLKREA